MKKIIIISIMVCSKFVSAQDFCGSTLNVEKARTILEQLQGSNSRNYTGNKPMIRLALHRITKANGTGGFTWNEIRQWIGTLPGAYEPHGICFTVVSEDDIANDTYFNMNSFYIYNTTYKNLIGVNRVENALNIYFVRDAKQGGAASGFLFDRVTAFPTVAISEYAGMGSGGYYNIFNTFVLAHEIGHCLGLLHTHETSGGVEAIPRSGSGANCTSAGDYLCDTEADPGLDISVSKVGDATCKYIGGASLGGLPYTPPVRNIMSYTLPHCMQHFTPGQGSRIRSYILNTGNLDAQIIPYNRYLTGVSSVGGAYYSAQGYIKANVPVTTSANVVFEAGEYIELLPGFATAGNTTFEAKIGTYSCVSPLVTNSAKTDETENAEYEYKEVQGKFINIYPNPSCDKITVEITGNANNPAEITIFDISGRKLKTVNTTSEKTEIEIGHLADGSYVAHINSNTFSESMKFSKLCVY